MNYSELIKILWSDMISSPWVASFGLIIICLIIFRKQLQTWMDNKLNNSSEDGMSYKSTYTKKDLYNHSIFKDLNYWLTTGIELVKIDKSYAKELIMKDLLVIKFTVIKDILKRFVDRDDLASISVEQLKSDVFNIIREINSKKVIGWRNSGIPEVFINKYLLMHHLSGELLFNSTKIFLSKNITADNFTRCYLILSVLENHLAEIYANAVNTALSLNGDLNGIVYKGVIIGKHNPYYAITNPVSKEVIESKLEEILVKSRSSRAAIFLFHDYKDSDVFSGKFSIIYEACAPGIKEEIDKVQFIPAYIVNDYEFDFKNGNMCVRERSQVNYELRELFQSQGTEKVVVYPLIENNRIKGFIGLTWDYSERFDRDSKDINIEGLLESLSKDVIHLILGRNNENIR